MFAPDTPAYSVTGYRVAGEYGVDEHVVFAHHGDAVDYAVTCGWKDVEVLTWRRGEIVSREPVADYWWVQVAQ